MADKQICPSCRHENEPQAAYCTRCGAVLDTGGANISTVTIDHKQGEAAVEAAASPEVSLRQDKLAFFVVGQTAPLIVDVASEIVLGRSQPGQFEPTVDFGEFRMFGVSRRHAMIVVIDNRYTIEDLESKNGTWLNGTLLVPRVPYTLRSGDQIRLGALTFYVYFHAPEFNIAE